MVVPAPLQACPQSSYRYDFVESHELPVLDLTRSLGGVCWSVVKKYISSNVVAPILHTADPLMTRPVSIDSNRLIDLGLGIGLLLAITVHCSPVAYGGPIAIVATTLALPSTLRVILNVRYDVAVLLFRSYEFWYLFVVNSVTCILVAAYFNDLRAIVGVLLWLALLNSNFLDAKTTEFRKVVAANLVGGLVSVTMLGLIQWGFVPAAHHFTVFQYRSHALCVEDLIVNGLATSTIMLVRNGYRRYQDIREQDQIKCTMLRCASYRCTIKFRQVDEVVTAHSILTGPSGQLPRYMTAKCKFNDMIYADSGTIYNASEMLCPVKWGSESWSRWQQLVVASIGLAGIVLTSFGFASVNHWPARLTRWLFAVGLTLTTVFCGFVWSMSHTKVLQQTFFSFDFVFLSLQLTSAHLCACDMFAWNSRCLGLLSSWLWIHLVLTSDALTPVVRQKLSMQTWHLAIPVLLFVIGQILFVCEIVFADHWALQDRRIHSVVVGNRRVEYRIIAFFFSRLVTILLWCLRLLWWILKAHPDDLVMLRGKVAYVYLDEAAGIERSIAKTLDLKAGIAASLGQMAPLSTEQPSPVDT